MSAYAMTEVENCPCVPPKNPPQRIIPHFIYALLSRKICIDLRQIPHDREQHRRVMQTLLPHSPMKRPPNSKVTPKEAAFLRPNREALFNGRF
jgi:hypothetical protein